MKLWTSIAVVSRQYIRFTDGVSHAMNIHIHQTGGSQERADEAAHTFSTCNRAERQSLCTKYVLLFNVSDETLFHLARATPVCRTERLTDSGKCRYSITDDIPYPTPRRVRECIGYN